MEYSDSDESYHPEDDEDVSESDDYSSSDNEGYESDDSMISLGGGWSRVNLFEDIRLDPLPTLMQNYSA